MSQPSHHPTPAARRSAILAARVDIAAGRLLAALDRAQWNPNQPRIPAGESGGGRWTDGSGSADDRAPISDPRPPTSGLGRAPIRSADASGKVPQPVLDDLAHRIEIADAKLDNALRRASSGIEISRAEEERARLAIAEKALAQVGSTAWIPSVAKDDFPAGSNKCNLFVHDVLKDVEADPPLANGNRISRWFGHGRPTFPLLAGQWGDRAVDVPGWSIVTGVPEPGDVVAIKDNSGGATGHTGIHIGQVDGRRWTVSAGTLSVVPSEWPFRPTDLDRGLVPVYRRYHERRRP